MGLLDEIKKEATQKGVHITSSEGQKIETEFNKLFYLPKVESEVKFIRQMFDRGTGTQDRFGLHASALIQPENSFCYRAQVLSLFYKQIQGENISPGLKRIFEEGNAIHEKWQRLFLRGGLTVPKLLDYTRWCDEFDVSFTPDAIIKIPELFGDEFIVVEIKSVNTMQFRRMTDHPTGRKQMQWYLELLRRTSDRDITKGIILCDDKNTQDFKVFYHERSEEQSELPVERAEKIQVYKQRHIEEGKLPPKHKDCKSCTSKKACECAMRDACFNMGMGRVPLDV